MTFKVLQELSLAGSVDSFFTMASVDDLIPYSGNPKLHPDSQIEQIANSIREWGFTIPVLIDPEGNVIAGHGRLLAAKQVGLSEVPCMVAHDWTEKQKRAYVIADNKLAESSEWDTNQYFNELKEISESGFDMKLLGVDDEAPVTPYVELIVDFSDTLDSDVPAADKTKPVKKSVSVECPHCSKSFVV